MTRALWWKITPPAVLAAATLLLLLVYARPGELLDALGSFRYPYLAAVLALASLNYVTRFVRWELYLRRCDVRLPLRRSAGIFFSGLAMSVTPGKAGELAKCVLLRDDAGTRFAVSAPVVVAERFSDLLGVLLLLGLGMTRYSFGRAAFVLAIAIVAALFLLLAYSEKVVARLAPMLTRRLLKGRAADGAGDMARAMSRLMRGPFFVAGAALGALAWFWECLAFWVVLAGLGEHGTSLFTATFVYAFATLAGALSLLPGGLGVTEGSMAGLLVLFHVGRENAAAGTVIIRACTLWFAVLLGVLAYVAYRRMAARSHRGAVAGRPTESAP
jgi:uncharacterized protein (TIRG00374 family)